MSKTSEADPQKKHVQAFIISFIFVLIAPIYALFDIMFIGHFKMPVDDVTLLVLTVFSMVMGALVWLRKPVGLVLAKITFVLWPVYGWWARWFNPGENSVLFAVAVTAVAIPLLYVSFAYNLEED